MRGEKKGGWDRRLISVESVTGRLEKHSGTVHFAVPLRIHLALTKCARNLQLGKMKE